MKNKIIQYLKYLNGLRRITRVLGFNPFIYKIFYGNYSYEENFDAFFSNKILTGFTVYDIGANIGHYSTLYSKLVGENGKVFAFEPSLKNFQILLEKCNTGSNKNLFSINAGIGSTNSKLFIQQGQDDIGATSKMSQYENGNGNWIQVFTLNSIVSTYGIPNAIKIDVEGFELEVLQGADKILKNDKIKVIGIEIHSEILNNRGVYNCHDRIERILKHNGFKIYYPDFSHIIGYK